MNEADAEKVLVHAHSVCRQMDDIAEVYRQFPESPSAKRSIRLCGDTISSVLHAIMLPLLVQHPGLDMKLFAGRFDARNFQIFPLPESNGPD